MKNIYRRKDGRFEGRCRDPRTLRIRYFYGKSRAEAERKMRDFLNGRGGSDCRLTVGMLFEEWLDAVSVKVKESTLANYRGKAQAHILPEFGRLRAGGLTAAAVKNFISARLDGGLSPGYVADIVILLKSVMKYGERVHDIRNDISDVILPKKRRADILLPDKAQQKRLERWLSDNPGLTSLGITLCLYTGIRLGELCALKWSDIDLSAKTLSVTKTLQRIRCRRGTRLITAEPKSTSSIRVIPLPDRVLALLERYRSAPENYLLSGTSKPVEPRTMQYRFKTVLKKANLPSVHFHALRHLFATNCVELGIDVKSLSEILGHSGVEITLNRYVHSSLERKKKFMKKLCFAA